MIVPYLQVSLLRACLKKLFLLLMKHCCRIHSFWHLRIEVIRKHCITALVTKLVPPSSCSLISSRSVVHEGWLPFQWCLLLVYQQQTLWNWLELLVLVSVYLLQYAGVFSSELLWFCELDRLSPRKSQFSHLTIWHLVIAAGIACVSRNSFPFWHPCYSIPAG